MSTERLPSWPAPPAGTRPARDLTPGDRILLGDRPYEVLATAVRHHFGASRIIPERAYVLLELVDAFGAEHDLEAELLEPIKLDPNP